MFEDLFTYPKVLARHRAGPSADARERFLAHCAGCGAARGTLLRFANELMVVAERIDVNSGSRWRMPRPRSMEPTAPRSSAWSAFAQAIGDASPISFFLFYF